MSTNQSARTRDDDGAPPFALEAPADRTRSWAFAALGWLILVSAGFLAMIAYKSVGGPRNAAPDDWPTATTLAHSAVQPTLIMFVHPQCVCSKASMAELGRLVNRLPGRISVEVVFARPPGTADGWERTPLREAALAIPGVVVVDDPGNVEAERFGAATSGTTLLYDASGRLLFAGGITSLRGHEGPSFGQERIVALVTDGHADRRDSPVFGCELQGDAGVRPGG